MRWIGIAVAILACKLESSPPVDAPGADGSTEEAPATFGLLHHIEGHAGDVWEVAYGKRPLAITVERNGKSQIWDVEKTKPIAELAAEGANPQAFAIDADAELVLAAVDNAVKLVDLGKPNAARTVVGSTQRLRGLGFATRGDAYLVYAQNKAYVGSKKDAAAPAGREIGEYRWATLGPRGQRILVTRKGALELLPATEGPAVLSTDARSGIFNPNGTRVLTRGNKSCALWNADTGAKVREVKAPKGCGRLDFSADGKLAAVGTGSKTVVLDPKSGKTRRTVQGGHGVVGGGRVAVAHAGAVKFYAVAGGKPQAEIATTGTPAVLSSGAGALLIDDAVSSSIWTVPDANIVERFDGTRSPGALFRSDGKNALIYADRGSFAARLIDLPDGKVIGSVGQGRFEVNDLAVAPGGRTVAIAGTQGLHIADVESGELQQCPKTAAHAGVTYSAAVFFGPVGVVAATEIDVHGNLPRIDVINLKDCSVLASHDNVSVDVLEPIVGVDATGGVVFARRAAAKDAESILFALDTDGNAKELGRVEALGALALHPDGNEMAFASSTGPSTLSGKTLGDLTAPQAEALAFSPDGAVVAAARRDGRVWLIDVSTWKVTTELAPAGKTEAERVRVAFAGGERVIVTTPGGDLRAYDLRTNGVAFELGVDEVATAAAVSPKGRWLALARGPVCEEDSADSRCAAAAKRPIEILETAKFTTVTSLDAHTGTVTSLAFSPNAGILASGAADHSLAIWSLPAEQ